MTDGLLPPELLPLSDVEKAGWGPRGIAYRRNPPPGADLPLRGAIFVTADSEVNGLEYRWDMNGPCSRAAND
jgi:hypothetical protein